MAKSNRKTRTRTLIGMISDQAMKTFPHDLMWQENGWNLWCDHWRKTAEQIRSDFEKEGLVETAKAVQDHIEWNKTLPRA